MLTLSHPPRLDKGFALHTPSWETTPAACLSCGAPIVLLEDWLNSECPAARPLDGGAR